MKKAHQYEISVRIPKSSIIHHVDKNYKSFYKCNILDGMTYLQNIDVKEDGNDILMSKKKHGSNKVKPVNDGTMDPSDKEGGGCPDGTMNPRRAEDARMGQ